MFATKLSYVICLSVMIVMISSKDEYKSSDLRATDFVFDVTEDSDTSQEIKFSDYQSDGINASIPKKIYLQPNMGSDAIASHPEDPRQIIMIIRKSGKLGLPGGFNNYGEDTYKAAARKFMEEVFFKVPVESNEDGQTKIHKMSAAPAPGYFGRNILKFMNAKNMNNKGPMLGLFGVADRDPRKQAIAVLYHFSLKSKYTEPFSDNKDILDVLYCDVTEILARNLDQITDTPSEHPLHPLFEKLSLEDQTKISNSSKNDDEEEISLASLVPCANEVAFDYIKMIYTYYKAMINNNIINADGSKHEQMENLKILYNKDVFDNYTKKKLI